MSIIATAVKHLLAAGVTGDALVVAIAEMEAAQPKYAAAEKRRAYDRERKRRANSTGIPPESAEIAETPTPSPSSSPDPSNNPTPAPVEHTPRARRAGAWPVPEGVEQQHWADFLANRKRKRLANSQTAFDGVMRDLAEKSDAHWPPGALVQHAAAKGWGSINYPSDHPRNGHRNDPVQRNRGAAPQSRDGFLNALNEMSGYSAADYRH